MSLAAIITVDAEKCVNCHKCIAVCPVKYCNNAMEDHVTINNDLCLSCGQCITACTHEARGYQDDTSAFLDDVQAGKQMVAIVAPAIAAAFPDDYLRFNAWLKSLGVAAVFDVSFGAELTIRSYLNHLKENKPRMVIAQPCPALVTYIELYRPELLPYLAPADSPMMHTMKMIRHYYPRFSRHRIVIISPCIAKKQEFHAVGIGDYNVTLSRLNEYINKSGVNLKSFPEIDFDNDPAERAVLFSTPGGLLRTAERDATSIGKVTRKIEGPEVIYHYLEHLPAQVEIGEHPVLIDCLNCEKGCNGGTGTPAKTIHADTLEHRIEKRQLAMRQRYHTQDGQPGRVKKVQKIVGRYWKTGIYNRRYEDRSSTNTVIHPDDNQMQVIYQDMLKFKPEDFLNCASCGYDSCEGMAVAIFNKLNRKENCYYFINQVSEKMVSRQETIIKKLSDEIHTITESAGVIEQSINQLVELIHEQQFMVAQTTSAIEEESRTIQSLVDKMESNTTIKLVELTRIGGDQILLLGETMKDISLMASQMKEIVSTIDEISNRTNILSINASIQSAHAGQFGKPFSVVAQEIKTLSANTARHVEEIEQFINHTKHKLQDAAALSLQGGDSFQEIAKEVNQVDSFLQEFSVNMDAMSENSRNIYQVQTDLKSLSEQVLDKSRFVEQNIGSIRESLLHLKNI